jgi:serine/threonine-protein kinase
MAVIYAQVSEPPPRLTSRRPGLPPQVDRVFALALAKAPQNRYATCGGSPMRYGKRSAGGRTLPPMSLQRQSARR